MDQVQYEQSINTYNAYLDRMMEAARHFCEDLLDSNYQEVSSVLPALIEGISWVNEALESFVNIGWASGERLQELRQMIHGLHEALENKDNVLLYDLLQFDAIPFFENAKISATETN
jgi:hypothetical protein